MDMIWQEFLGIKNPTLPCEYHTENFTNQELNTLLSSFGGGNSLTDPKSIGTIAEYYFNLYRNNGLTREEYDKDVKQMYIDGLGRFLNTLWNMIINKK